MLNVYGNPLVYLYYKRLCDIDATAPLPLDCTFVLSMYASCDNKAARIPDAIPTGMEYQTDENGRLYVFMDKPITLSDIHERDLCEETEKFLMEVREMFGVQPNDEYDVAEWMLIPSKSVADSLIDFCIDSDKPNALLESYSQYSKGREQRLGLLLSKIPYDEDRGILMAQLIPGKWTPLFDNEQDQYWHARQIGCYFRKERKVCLFASTYHICEDIDRYVGDDNQKVVVLREDDVARPIVKTIIDMVGTSLDKVDAYFELLPYVKRKLASFSLDDAESILADKEKWSNDQVKAILDDARNQKAVSEILFPESKRLE